MRQILFIFIFGRNGLNAGEGRQYLPKVTDVLVLANFKVLM
jgi:hypothetical protein